MSEAVPLKAELGSLPDLAQRIKTYHAGVINAARDTVVKAISAGALLKEAKACMSSEHFGQLAWQFERMSGSSGLKVQAAIAC
jgi:hypothetical protein